MYRAERNQLRSELNGYIQKGILSEKERIIVFGVSAYSREIIGYLDDNGIDVSSVIDNDSRKNGQYCRGIRVSSPNELDDISKTRDMYIICSAVWREMREQLIHNGISEGRILTIVLKSFRESLLDRITDLYHGYKIYRNIVKKYPLKKVFLCPYTGTGDIYLIGTLFQQYIRRKEINDYVFVVVSRPCAMVADIFPIDNVVQIDGPDACRSLIKYYMIFPERCDIKILNDSWGDIYTNPIQWIRGLHGMDFKEMFRRFVFELDKDCMPEHPDFKDVHDEVDRIFADLDLHEGKTAIIAPYATTLADMPVSFWINLSERLTERGITVCTNCGGEDEKEIPGTKRITFPLNIAPQLVEKAGLFVGIRSGLCDVISGADARKIILYDKANYFFNCSAYEYFSLNKMGLCSDAIEIEYDNTDTEVLVDKIMEIL